MKILYGVQGTGNGHITRARVMAKALQQHGVEVDFLFSGRHPDAYFDMDCFGDYQTHKGLTFEIKDGKIKYFQTLLKNNIFQFIKDVKSCDLSEYICVLCDFEPITAWAARDQDVPWSLMMSPQKPSL